MRKKIPTTKKRLSPEVKAKIAKEASTTGTTLASLAEKFSVSVPTISRIVGPRRGVKQVHKKRGRPAGSKNLAKTNGSASTYAGNLKKGDAVVTFSDSSIVITLHANQKALVRKLLKGHI